MFRLACAFLSLLALLAAGPLSAAEEPTIRIRVSAADPASGGRLAPRDTLYLRISYDSPVPLRFRAEGFSGETAVTEGVAYNPAPVYPAGKHEALVWISYFGPARIDEVRIGAKDAAWKPLRSLSYPVAAEWAAGAPRHERAAWAAELNDRQQAMTSSAMTTTDGSGGLGSFLVALAAASIPAYVCLQIFMVFRYSGGWRVAAGLPLVVMIPLALYTLAALAMGSSLWPLMMLLLTPPAFLYLVGLLIVRLLSRAVAPS
ncbi:MAG: hypothetical protein GEU87_10850 [Alphaproteobacteria bacterium]|nr:hypothetical protein [Alphaproteobacteria bacterium]